MLQIASSTPPSVRPADPPPTSPMRDAARDLAVALRNDDLAGARQAFVAVVKAAPDTAQWNPDSSIAAVGRALVQGDMPGAKEAAKAGLADLRGPWRPGVPEPRPLPEPAPGPSSTGGLAGSNVNLVA